MQGRANAMPPHGDGLRRVIETRKDGSGVGERLFTDLGYGEDRCQSDEREEKGVLEQVRPPVATERG